MQNHAAVQENKYKGPGMRLRLSCSREEEVAVWLVLSERGEWEEMRAQGGGGSGGCSGSWPTVRSWVSTASKMEATEGSEQRRAVS